MLDFIKKKSFSTKSRIFVILPDCVGLQSTGNQKEIGLVMCIQTKDCFVQKEFVLLDWSRNLLVLIGR